MELTAKTEAGVRKLQFLILEKISIDMVSHKRKNFH